MPQIFPKWSNTFAKAVPIILLLKAIAVVFIVWYWCSPKHLDVGYQPEQPIPFSHKLHASNLGIDCMYCHNLAEKSPHAGVPPTSTCMNCHAQQNSKNPIRVAGIFRSMNEGIPIPWKRIHKIPDYAYFDHSAHISAGIGCISCHGRVDQMQVIRQEEPLSMGWCLNCHRDPEKHLRPPSEVTNMTYHQSETFKKMAKEKAKNLNAPVENCSGCHR